jgi:hypothetical protein
MSEPVHTSETPATSDPAPVEPTPTELTPEPAAPAEPRPTETVDFWKRKAREQEDRAKANAKAAEKLKEIEDRDLSELQRAQRDRETLAEENARLRSESARNRVALQKGLPAEIAETLNGSNEEELAAHADRLIAWRGNQAPPAPRPDPGQGPRPTSPAQDEDAEYSRFFPQG